MNTAMKVQDISIEIILKEKIQYAESDLNSEESEDYMYMIQGEIAAYHEILEDIRDHSVKKFVKKYIKIVNKVHNNIENNINLNENRVAWMSGYNNAIVDILKLIHPSYEFGV